VALSYCCSPRGGIVSELTLARLPGGRFWLLSAAAAERHDEEWLRSHLSVRDGPVSLMNLTARYGTLILAGPRSRALLARITAADLSNDASRGSRCATSGSPARRSWRCA
jgi:dimethylglycine dehydrogenase